MRARGWLVGMRKGGGRIVPTNIFFLFRVTATLIRVVLAQLEQFVENDYTIVMFSGGALYRPGWGWLFKAYRSLNRRQVDFYRKVQLIATEA